MLNLYETQCSQVESEFVRFLDILRQENVKSFLEIGSRFGGSLWRIANVLPKGSLIVSCDSGKGMGGKKPGAQNSLKSCVKRLKSIGYNSHLVIGHSQREATIAAVKRLGPYDAIFIDGDHEYRGVREDWKTYGPCGRIVAFHDVGWQKPDGYNNPKVVEVPRLWNEIKGNYRHQEFTDRDAGGNMGIGVLWTR
jgi:predicted O-methyltransferase YrrM